MNDAQRAALLAALKLPYPTFPCRADKTPATPNGFKNATFPEAGLATLWARYPGDLIGVATGEFSGVAVLDIDRGKGGGEWYATNKIALPSTRMHRTRSGGLHLLFRHQAGLKSRVSKIAPGVDTRGDGGYIIWWPAAGFEVRDHALADWPTWLSEEPKAATAIPTTNVRPFIPEDTYKRGSLDAKIVGIAKRLERAREGERNAILFWAACRVGAMLRDGELSRFVSERWCADLLALAAARAGLPDQEARRTIASGFGKVA